MARRSITPAEPVRSCRPMSIHSGESMRGAATIMSSSNRSVANWNSSSALGDSPTVQMALRMGMGWAFARRREMRAPISSRKVECGIALYPGASPTALRCRAHPRWKSAVIWPKGFLTARQILIAAPRALQPAANPSSAEKPASSGPFLSATRAKLLPRAACLVLFQRERAQYPGLGLERQRLPVVRRVPSEP